MINNDNIENGTNFNVKNTVKNSHNLPKSFFLYLKTKKNLKGILNKNQFNGISYSTKKLNFLQGRINQNNNIHNDFS
jgi:hypothetical protein